MSSSNRDTGVSQSDLKAQITVCHPPCKFISCDVPIQKKYESDTEYMQAKKRFIKNQDRVYKLLNDSRDRLPRDLRHGYKSFAKQLRKYADKLQDTVEKFKGYEGEKDAVERGTCLISSLRGTADLAIKYVECERTALMAGDLPAPPTDLFTKRDVYEKYRDARKRHHAAVKAPHEAVFKAWEELQSCVGGHSFTNSFMLILRIDSCFKTWEVIDEKEHQWAQMMLAFESKCKQDISHDNNLQLESDLNILRMIDKDLTYRENIRRKTIYYKYIGPFNGVDERRSILQRLHQELTLRQERHAQEVRNRQAEEEAKWKKLAANTLRPIDPAPTTCIAEFPRRPIPRYAQEVRNRRAEEAKWKKLEANTLTLLYPPRATACIAGILRRLTPRLLLAKQAELAKAYHQFTGETQIKVMKLELRVEQALKDRKREERARVAAATKDDDLDCKHTELAKQQISDSAKLPRNASVADQTAINHRAVTSSTVMPRPVYSARFASHR